MSAVGKRIRARDQALFDKVSATIKRNDDRSLTEELLHKGLVKELRAHFDSELALNQQAAKIIERLTRQDGEDDEEGDASLQLRLFNDVYDYNPKRLVKDDVGNIIEEDHAPLRFKLAELQRSADNLQRASLWNARKARALVHFQKWTDEQLEKKRAVAELTWGICARETGLLRTLGPQSPGL